MTAAARIVAALAVLAAAAVGTVLVARGDDHPYVIRLSLGNASGLREGGAVVIGGITAGRITALKFDDEDRVRVDLTIDAEHAPLGGGVSAAIAAQNLLGQKQVQLVPGADGDQPAPSGFVIPEDRVTATTDLDQVLDVLDADTRLRLGMIINEAGAAVVGRRIDIHDLIAQMKLGFADTTTLLNELVSDNQTLEQALVNSSRTVETFNRRRDDVERLIDRSARVSSIVAAKRSELQATLAGAPHTLITLRGFLRNLSGTTLPLGPAARQVQAVAPELSNTLSELEPFRRAAAPVLDTAADVAPRLSELARGVTPVLQRARPTVAALAAFSADALPGVSDTLDGSIDNLLAVMDNWSRAIQLRDGLSHVFRGAASINPDVVDSMVDRFLARKARREHRPAPRRRDELPAPRPQTGTAPAPASTPSKPDLLPQIEIPELKLPLGLRLPSGPLPGIQTGTGAPNVTGLLDYLLGK